MSKDVTWPGLRLARLLDLTPRRVQQLTKNGVLKSEARGRYSPTAVTDYIKYLRDRVPDPMPPKEFREALDEPASLWGTTATRRNSLSRSSSPVNSPANRGRSWRNLRGLSKASRVRKARGSINRITFLNALSLGTATNRAKLTVAAR
jgi:hypothetical protein